MPRLRKCPIASADVNYPACEHPAERPIFVNNYCHPCARVVWNKQVLEAEDKHRIQHKNGECECEVIFDQEERERRARSVVMSKGKEREHDGRGGHGHTGFAGRGRGGRGGFGRGGGRFGADHQRGGYHGGGQDGSSDASAGFGNARGGYRGGNHDFGRGNGMRNRQVDQFHQGPQYATEQFHQPHQSYNFDPDAKMIAHQYHGYNGEEYVPGHDQPSGYSAYIHPTENVMGQPGVGMKWFDTLPPLQPLLQFPPGATLPPLPAPLSASQPMVHQTPVHQNFSYASHYQTLDSGNHGRAGYTGYQIPITGPGLIYQKAASEPSNTFESPESAGTGYATARSKGHSHSVSADENSEGPSNLDTPTMKQRNLAKRDKDDDHNHLEQQTQNLVLSDTRGDDAGEGSSA